jgi:hypothetical protein
VVIERVSIPGLIHGNRELVLWMVAPVKHDRGEFAPNDGYSCPEETLGSYYSGPTRISLVDSESGRSINTISILHDGQTEDSFDIPYRILPGYYYQVPGKPPGVEGKPALLALRDLNGDGLALETAFYEKQSCMGLPITLIGYSRKRDRVIQYPVQLRRGESARPETMLWVDYLFAESPASPGHWVFKVDYRGRGGCLDSYDVRYDRVQEKFRGTLRSLMPESEPR